MTTENTIKYLDDIIPGHGKPLEINSNKGPSFEDFCAKKEMNHHIPEIQVGGSKDWVELKDLSMLPYCVPSGLSYCLFLKFRTDQIAAGLWDPTWSEDFFPPVASTSGLGGGTQSEPSHTSTPGNFISFSLT